MENGCRLIGLIAFPGIGHDFLGEIERLVASAEDGGGAADAPVMAVLLQAGEHRPFAAQHRRCEFRPVIGAQPRHQIFDEPCVVAKARLNEGSEQIDFKAHWSVLPKQTNDLRLSDFVIERMSPSPGERNSFGQSKVSEFTIEDFAYDSLQQLPYQANKQELQSLEFLQGLAAGR